MASIRLQFPDGQPARGIALRGARITVGRAPDNTVQILDRTLSAHHAEFVEHGDHYHLRDTASTNGVFVNGERVTDFHLRESCRIGFGTFECEFDSSADAADSGIEALPTAVEMRSLRDENAELRASLATLQQEVSALLPAATGGEQGAATGEEHDLRNLIAERAAMREAQQASGHEVARLQGELAVALRDRDNLQRAWDTARADLDAIRHELAAEEPAAPASPSVTAAVPRSTVSAVPRAVPAATPRAVPAPIARPAPSAVPQTPGGPGSGAKLVPRAVPAPAARPGGALAPGSAGQPRAVPRATPAAPQPKPGGTQKL